MATTYASCSGHIVFAAKLSVKTPSYHRASLHDCGTRLGDTNMEDSLPKTSIEIRPSIAMPDRDPLRCSRRLWRPFLGRGLVSPHIPGVDVFFRTCG